MNTVEDAFFEQLHSRAIIASERAYAPYSGFRVGAAIAGKNGQIYSGCNVENTSYGLTCCAERNAIFQMIAAGESAFSLLVIYTPTSEPTAPCGACRQVLNEFSPDALVCCLCDGPGRIEQTVQDLLPAAFQLKPHLPGAS